MHANVLPKIQGVLLKVPLMPKGQTHVLPEIQAAPLQRLQWHTSLHVLLLVCLQFS